MENELYFLIQAYVEYIYITGVATDSPVVNFFGLISKPTIVRIIVYVLGLKHGRHSTNIC